MATREMRRVNMPLTPAEVSQSYKKSRGRWRAIFGVAIVILLFNLLAGTLIAFYGPKLGSGLQESVVRITTSNGGGTGFFVHEKYVATAAHVAGDVGNDAALKDGHGRTMSGKVIASGYAEWKNFVVTNSVVKTGATPHDWALIEVETGDDKPAALVLGSRADTEQGKPVFLAGHPQGQDLTVTKGVISRIDVEEIFTDAELDPGFSGGPMIAVEGNDPPEKGYVVGIMVSSPAFLTSIKTAIPIDILLQQCTARGINLY